MRILVITDLYPIENSGEPLVIKEFAKTWQEEGHIVDVIRPNFLLNTKIRHKKIFKNGVYFEDNIKIMNVNCITPFFFDVKKKLPKDFAIGNYNLIISHMPSGALFAMKLLGKCAGIPYVISVHNSDITVLIKPLYKKFFAPALKKAYKRADAVAARSSVLAEKIKELSPYAQNKTFVAASGINKDIIDSMEIFEHKAKYKNEPYVITTVAKLIKRKNVDVILKALAMSNLKDYVFKIIGDGDEAENLKNLAKELDIDDKVIFTGNIPHNEVLVNLTNSDLFILVSEGETFGMAYLEAAARANIVVASKNDGIDGLIKDGENGFTCDPDADTLSILLDRIYNMPREDVRKMLLKRRCELLESDDKALSKKYLDTALKIIGV